MKLRNKDQIITCLIDILSDDLNDSSWTQTDSDKNRGWVECLKWVLSLTDEEQEVFIKGKNTLVVKEKTTYAEEQIREAVDIVIGDDGFRSKEVIEVLKSERKDNGINTTD